MAASLLGKLVARRNQFRASCGIYPLQSGEARLCGIAVGVAAFQLPAICWAGVYDRAGGRGRWILKILGMNVGMSGYATLTRPTELVKTWFTKHCDLRYVSYQALYIREGKSWRFGSFVTGNTCCETKPIPSVMWNISTTIR